MTYRIQRILFNEGLIIFVKQVPNLTGVKIKL